MRTLAREVAKSLQGLRPEDAVAWAAGEIRKIYGA